jgi:hypothetical protein
MRAGFSAGLEGESFSKALISAEAGLLRFILKVNCL